jgi:hypothetical protein
VAQTDPNGAPVTAGSPGGPAGGDADASQEAKSAIAEEAVLNAAVAFAGHVVTAAQQGAEEAGQSASAAIRELMVRQYLLETATLCLRRLGESYDTAAGDPSLEAVTELLRDGARRAHEATATVEALGDLGLDVLDQLLDSQ